MTLPNIERVLIGGTAYEGPVYARNGDACSLRAGVPNARQPYQRFGGEARLAELPELPIVMR